MKSLEELFQIKNEVIEMLEDYESEPIELEFVIELAESNISALLGDENRVKVERMEWALNVIKNRTSAYPEFEQFNYIAKQGLGEKNCPLDWKK